MKPKKLNAKSPKWKSEKTCLVTKISQNDVKNDFVYSREYFQSLNILLATMNLEQPWKSFKMHTLMKLDDNFLE